MKLTKQDIVWPLIMWAAIVTALLLPIKAVGQQVNCDSVVAFDQALVFSSAQGVDEITKAAGSLIDQGADVHVVSFLTSAPLIVSETNLEMRCPSWQVNGRRKPNLFLMVVSPLARKKNVFFGAAYGPVFQTEDAINSIYSQAANPYFRQADFAGGVAAALKDFGAKVAAFHDQAKHPVVAATVVQATDLSGLWVVMGWTLLAVALFGAVWFVLAWSKCKHDEREAVDAAQSSAIKARERAVRLYTNRDDQAKFAARFLELSNSIGSDPDTAGLTVVQYNTIRDLWNDFADDLAPMNAVKDAPRRYKKSKTFGASYGGGPSPQPEDVHAHAGEEHIDHSKPKPEEEYRDWSRPVHSTTIINNNSSSGGSDLLTGMLVGEALSEPRYEVPSHHEPEGSGSDSSYSDSSSSDDSFSSGSDSSYSDSSSSSDFGGGGSDSSF